MKNPKFQVSDVVVRAAYQNMKSAMMRDECTILEIVSDEHPICAQMWYVCADYRGRRCNGLVSVMDDCFVLKN